MFHTYNYSERDPGSNTRLKVKELHCDDDRSSQSCDNDEDSYMEVEHQGVVVRPYCKNINRFSSPPVPIFTLHARARGKVIGCVIVVVVISKKIVISRG